MEKEKRKKVFKYIWNGLFVLVLLMLFIPSWRITFQSTIQRLFMTSVKLEETGSKVLTISTNEWLIFDQHDKPISFHQFGDKPIVLNFWATWCPPCVAELPGLHEFYEAVKNHAHVIAVSDESMEKLMSFGAFDKYPGMIFKIKNILPAFQFSAYPTTFILAPDFRIVSKIEGAEHFATAHNIEFIKNLK